MIRIKLFGTPTIVGPAGSTESLASRPKGIALLAYLAATPGPCTRDTLIGLFWPEVDEEHARASLRQALYAIRRALGPGVVRGSGRDLIEIDRKHVDCDVQEFERLSDAGACAEALELYAPFMNGFPLEGLPELERWFEGERQRLRLAALDAVWRLAEQSTRRGDAQATRRWVEKAVAIAPYDESGVRLGMRMHTRLGNRALALKLFEDAVERLRAGVDLEASPETIELASAIRSGATVQGHPPSEEAGESANVISAPEPAIDATPPVQPPSPLGAPADRPRRLPLRSVYALSALFVLAFGLYAFDAQSTSAGAPAQGIQSVLVLPLRAAPGDDGEHAFADEMTESLIAELGSTGAVRVLSRTTAIQARERGLTLEEIAGELQVDAVVEGAVARHDGRVRVSIRLIATPSDRQLWSESYEEDMRDVLMVQRRIAHSVVDEINVRLDRAHADRGKAGQPVHPDAYAAYVRGRYHFSRWTASGFSTAAQAFAEAIGRDSSYAEAWVGLSTSLSHLCYFGIESPVDPAECEDTAESAVLRALELDPLLSDAHVIHGLRLWWGPRRDPEGAERALRRALELNPSNAEAHNRYAFLLSTLERHDEAIRAFERAYALDPLSPERAAFRAWGYAAAGRYERAEHLARQAIALDPTFPNGFAWLGFWILPWMGRYDEAVQTLERARELAGTNSTFAAMLGYVHGRAGNTDEAEAILQSLLPGVAVGRVPQINLALVHVGLGRHQEAIDWIERAYEDGWGHVIYLNINPAWQPLRPDPRFQRIVRDVGLRASTL